MQRDLNAEVGPSESDCTASQSLPDAGLNSISSLRFWLLLPTRVVFCHPGNLGPSFLAPLKPPLKSWSTPISKLCWIPYSTFSLNSTTWPWTPCGLLLLLTGVAVVGGRRKICNTCTKPQLARLKSHPKIIKYINIFYSTHPSQSFKRHLFLKQISFFAIKNYPGRRHWLWPQSALRKICPQFLCHRFILKFSNLLLLIQRI